LSHKIYVTLDDIAKKLKVSKVTVSKALRGHPDISKHTSALVKKVAADLGYTPNYMARNLSSKSTHTIGVVIPKIAHFFFSSLIEAIYDTAFHSDYEIILTVSQENEQREQKHLESLLAMKVDGIIISISENTRDKSIFEKIRRMQVPLVFVDRVMDIPGASTIVVDDNGGAFQATEAAIKKGYTKIAHIAGYREINIGENRYLGFESAMKKYGIPLNPDWLIFGGFGEDDGYKGFMQIYEKGDLPEFILAVTYPVALGIYAAVEQVGLRIPQDIDIICFGNSGINKFIKPSMSYMDQNTDILGKTAVDLILNHIKTGNPYEPQHIKIPTQINLRETCIDRKKAV
jgi:LacI family transcriptional regulator